MGNRRQYYPCILTTIILVVIFIFLFIALFVILPVIFKYSPELQRRLVFRNAERPVNTNFEEHGLVGVRNFYVQVNQFENVTLGVWHILPEELVNQSHSNDRFNYDDLLLNTEYPVLIYFGGNANNRANRGNAYPILRMFFHVISFDYRGYGDSTPLRPSEEGIVSDAVQLYKWLHLRTNGDIYVWGTSLGSSLSTHTIAKLHDEGIVPAGLFLGSPFTSMKDEVKYYATLFWFNQIFSWLPWYENMIIESFEENGFRFETVEHILDVNCPVMIVHAEDDTIVPFELGEKLYLTAKWKRNETTQGSVTFHSIPRDANCNHYSIFFVPEITDYIKDHIDICNEFQKKKV